MTILERLKREAKDLIQYADSFEEVVNRLSDANKVANGPTTMIGIMRSIGGSLPGIIAEIERLQKENSDLNQMLSVRSVCQMQKEIDSLRSRVVELEKENSSLRFEVSKMRQVLYQLKREYGHYSINAGTSTLGLFVDMVCKDTHFVDERAQQLEADAARWAWVDAHVRCALREFSKKWTLEVFDTRPESQTFTAAVDAARQRQT